MSSDIYYERAQDVPEELKEIALNYFKTNKITTFRMGLEIIWVHVIEDIMKEAGDERFN